MNEKAWKSAVFSIKTESEAIADILGYLKKEPFLKAADILSDCGKIITSGCGGSGIAAKKFAHSLCCIERDAYFLPPSEALHGGLGCVKAGDAVVLLSRGGKTSELLPVISLANSKKAALIAVTENMDSPLARSAQAVLPLKIRRESDPLDIMTTSSFVAAAAIFDALLAAVMEITGYRLEQFAPIHPGGAVGEMLNN
jgi:D-arabinose 5-phosphate isomerase GutQ